MKGIINQKIWLLVVLLFFGLGCNFFNGISEKLNTVQSTAEGIATEAEEGKNILKTGQAIATKVVGSEVLLTLQAGATKIDESGIVETAKAFTTQEVPGLKATMENIATEYGTGVVGTLEAFTTNEVPSLKETARAMSTKVPSFTGEHPDDIPIMPGGEENLYGNDKIIFYSINSSLESVLEFYSTEMLNLAWKKIENETFVKQDTATLSYEKDSRKVKIILMTQQSENKTAIFIYIQD